MLKWILAGVVFRVLLTVIFPSLPDFLGGQVECVTAMSSFSRLKEGLFLLGNGQSPYAGGPFHQSPLLLAIFSVVPTHAPMVDLFYACVDSLAAYQLAEIATAAPTVDSFDPSVVVAIYMFNPFTLVSSLARSTQTITNAALVAAFGSASTYRGKHGAIYLALAACIGWYPAYFLPSYAIYAQRHASTPWLKTVAVFIASSVAFTGLAYLPVGSWQFLDKQYSTLLQVRDLTAPNLGLWWYFFIELFEFFRPFFVGAFQLFVAGFILPLTLRFWKNPLFAAVALQGMLAMLKPYPEASDVGLYLSLLALNKRIVELMEYPLIIGVGFLYVAALAPIFYYLWIYVGSGNANFFYAITLVHALTLILAMSDTVWAAIRLDYDGGKTKNLTQL